jgi:hypothetical protein
LLWQLFGFKVAQQYVRTVILSCLRMLKARVDGR